jgi:hypothetical protein
VAIGKWPANQVGNHGGNAIRRKHIPELCIAEIERLQQRWPKKPLRMKRQRKDHFAGNYQCRNSENSALHQVILRNTVVGVATGG